MAIISVASVHSSSWRENPKRNMLVGRIFVPINKITTYNHTNLTGTPVYYRSECSVDVPVAELGEGTHSFRAFIYPDVTDGIDLVAATTASTTVTLSKLIDATVSQNPEHTYTCNGVAPTDGSSESTLTDKCDYAPVVTFTHDSALPEFNEGDTPTFTCTAQGNPPPNLTITRKRTNQQLASVQGNLKTTELTHTVDPLDCLDTDVYVCTGQNNQGVITMGIFVGVKCSQQLATIISQPKTVDLSLGETAELGLKIYGYPPPHLVTLLRTRDNTNLTGSARHLIEYSPRQAPFGFVNVTISDVVEEDFTNYTITVDNGEDDENETMILVYRFRLVEFNAEQRESKENTTITVVVVVLVVVVIAVIFAALVLRFRGRRQLKVLEPAQVVEYVQILPDHANIYEEITDQVSEEQGMGHKGQRQLQVSQPKQTNEYEYVDDPTNKPEAAAPPFVEAGMKPRDQKQAQTMQSKQTNEYEEYDPDPNCKPKGATSKLFGEKDKRPKGQRQLQVSQPQQTNKYEEYVADPTNKPEGAVHLCEEEGMKLTVPDHKQFPAPPPDQKNVYEESSPNWAIGYEMPAQLFVKRSTRSETSKPVNEKNSAADTLQQPYANYSPPQQEDKDGQLKPYTNINFDFGEEKCVYVNTAGQGT
ncbi:protein amalgam-like protein [Plakobranchus ocellatus]|uniref:Protein amalgam-like protein n=1 Tax=Plakobranchus ocellatus TaxID=259542 RepID=A0AAV4APN9_9GAST|nr:protein amalgam-like protein [Plakobranchus ocellatus]